MSSPQSQEQPKTKRVFSPETYNKHALKNLKIIDSSYDGLFFGKPTLGGGHCFFHAILDAVYRPYRTLNDEDKTVAAASFRTFLADLFLTNKKFKNDVLNKQGRKLTFKTEDEENELTEVTEEEVIRNMNSTVNVPSDYASLLVSVFLDVNIILFADSAAKTEKKDGNLLVTYLNPASAANIVMNEKLDNILIHHMGTGDSIGGHYELIVRKSPIKDEGYITLMKTETINDIFNSANSIIEKL